MTAFRSLALCTACLILSPVCAIAEDASPNAVLKQLLEPGVAVNAEIHIPLIPPAMPDGLDAAGQKKALASIADANHPLDQLMRDSPVAPFVLKLEKLDKAAPDTTSRTVDLYFIAYGKLDVIYTPEFRDQLARMATEAEDAVVPTKTAVLDEKQVAARKLIEPAARAETEMWLYGKFPMLDRVYISATRHAISNRTDESIVLASLLDERLQADAEFPNQWQAMDRDTSGKFVLGPAQPYSGAGFYVKVTRLIEPADALFIEYHHAFVEPQGWFNGTSLLRSKLPLVAQDRVRKFRRQLATASGRK